jgi:hypothetical protein
MGIILPSQGENANVPPRLNDNWNHGHANCYAKYWIYPKSGYELSSLIEDAFDARTSRSHLISNSQTMMKYNSKCNVHGVTH